LARVSWRRVINGTGAIGLEIDKLAQYATLETNGARTPRTIGVAGIEFIRDFQNNNYTYDINTNTNYNSRAEAKLNVSGMGMLADFLGRELATINHAQDS